MSDHILNVRFFHWHLQISENWSVRIVSNDFHRDGRDGWFRVYQFGEHNF